MRPRPLATAASRWMMAALLLAIAIPGARSAPAPAPASAPLPKIKIAADGHGFSTVDGRPFVPFGVTYYRPGTGWAPQVWKKFDAEATRRDFARLRELGGNCVRVFLTYGSFYPEPGRLDETAVARLEQFLDLAAAEGLYVHPTGPDHWEGLPDWAKGDRITDEKVLSALEDFWRLLATRLRGRTAVFAYDLLNEPEVPWDSPSLRAKWNHYLESKYRDHASLTNAWHRSEVPPFGNLMPPPKEDALLDPRLLDFQRFREDLAEAWTRRQSQAIKAADPDALVTVGLIQWSVPMSLAHVGHYAAFRPQRVVPHVDFLTFHFYPLAEGAYTYSGEEAERKNLAYLECLAREHARFGKPVLLGEFGWHGGGKPKAFKNAPPATEEQQARWCRLAVESTRGWVSGWLNWGFHDQPEATDVSEFTGLLTADGKTKAWGTTFSQLARDLAGHTFAAPAEVRRPALDWDRLVTSRKEIDAFRAEYFRAYANETR